MDETAAQLFIRRRRTRIAIVTVVLLLVGLILVAIGR